MRAAAITAPGGPDVLKLAGAQPRIRVGQVLADVTAWRGRCRIPAPECGAAGNSDRLGT